MMAVMLDYTGRFINTLDQIAPPGADELFWPIVVSRLAKNKDFSVGSSDYELSAISYEL